MELKLNLLAAPALGSASAAHLCTVHHTHRLLWQLHVTCPAYLDSEARPLKAGTRLFILLSPLFIESSTVPSTSQALNKGSWFQLFITEI